MFSQNLLVKNFLTVVNSIIMHKHDNYNYKFSKNFVSLKLYFS